MATEPLLGFGTRASRLYLGVYRLAFFYADIMYGIPYRVNSYLRLPRCPLGGYTVHFGAMTPISLRVKELRQAKGWSQAELAEKAGIRRATLSAIEAEQTTGVDFETLQSLAQSLGCDPGYLIVKKGK